MAYSLRQAYDYWQDQPGNYSFQRRRPRFHDQRQLLETSQKSEVHTEVRVFVHHSNQETDDHLRIPSTFDQPTRIAFPLTLRESPRCFPFSHISDSLFLVR